MSQVDDGAHNADDFAKFSTYKIDTVRTTISSVPLQDVPVTAKQVVYNWASVTAEDIANLT